MKRNRKFRHISEARAVYFGYDDGRNGAFEGNCRSSTNQTAVKINTYQSQDRVKMNIDRTQWVDL